MRGRDRAPRSSLQAQGLDAAVHRARRRPAAIVGMTTYMNIDAAHRARRDRLTPGTPGACSAAPLNTECKLLLLAHAFETLDCIAVEFRTHCFNHAEPARDRAPRRPARRRPAPPPAAPPTARCATPRCTASPRPSGPTVRAHLRWQLAQAALTLTRVQTPHSSRAMAKKKPIDVDDLWQIERVGGVSLSPDGAQAVCSVDALLDGREQGAASTSGCCPPSAASRAALTHCGEKDGQPAGRPRGERDRLHRQARAARQEGRRRAQLYVIAPDGGEARRVGDVAHRHRRLQVVPRRQAHRLRRPGSGPS